MLDPWSGGKGSVGSWLSDPSARRTVESQFGDVRCRVCSPATDVGTETGFLYRIGPEQ